MDDGHERQQDDDGPGVPQNIATRRAPFVGRGNGARTAPLGLDQAGIENRMPAKTRAELHKLDKVIGLLRFELGIEERAELIGDRRFEELAVQRQLAWLYQ